MLSPREREMQKTFWLVCLGGCVAVAAVAAQRHAIKPIASIMQLHEAMISPSSDALFDVGRETPKNDKEWIAVRNHAVILAESANMLMLDGRAKDNGEWMRFSSAMADAAAAALKAAEARNVDGILDAGDRIVPVCEACHEPYRDGGRKMGPPPR
jgi:hypothetical protein